MTDKPILFSALMVRALLDGSKTQTRRVLKPQPITQGILSYGEAWAWKPNDGGFSGATADQIERHGVRTGMATHATGDRLWVRETWRIGAWQEWRDDISGGRGDCPVYADELSHAVAIDYLADDFPRKEWLQGNDPEKMLRLVEQSRDDAKKNGKFAKGMYEHRWSPGQSPCRIRPSIFMPRWASRLTLTVTDVRVQRLQDISSQDVVREGVDCSNNVGSTMRRFVAGGDPPSEKVKRDAYHKAHTDAFSDLWNSINGPDAWEANPWAAAYSFDLHKCNIDQMGDA